MSKLKVFGALVFGSMLLASAFGFAAHNTVNDSNVGSGVGNVNGFTTSNTHYTLDTQGEVIGVSFNISPNASQVRVTTNSATGFGSGFDSLTNWTCTGGSPTVTCTATVKVDPEGITQLTVVAGA